MLCTSDVMKTVLPARDNPVTPILIDGENRFVVRPAKVSRAIRASSVSVVSFAKRQRFP